MVELEAEKAALERAHEPEPARTADERPPARLRPALVGVAALLVGGALALSLRLGPVGAVALATTSVIAGLCFVLPSLIEVVPPGFVLVLTGRRYRGPDGRERGYRVITAGRVLRVPLLEIADRLDVQPRTIELRVRSVYSQGGAPLDVALTAVIRVASSEPRVHDAIERFLGRERAEVDRVACQIVESQLRSLVAERTLEQLRQERFASELTARAEPDFAALGLELERLHLEHAMPSPAQSD